MATQQIFYERAVPITQQMHGDWSLDRGQSYEFARHASSVPLIAVEFPLAAAEYTIVFAGSEKALMPAAILGVRRDENLYLTPEGGWRAKYVPAFVRRYPFVFASSDDGKTFTLCIDESFEGFNKEGRGERLYAEGGKPSEFTESRLKFLREYQIQFQRTLALCGRLRELGLLEPMQATITPQGGATMSLTGFYVVSREKLKALSGEVLEKLLKTDELELIYMHLQSLRNFSAIGQMLVGTGSEQTVTATVA